MIMQITGIRRLFSHVVEVKSEKLGIHGNTKYQPFYYTDWHSFLVKDNLRSGVLLPCFDRILRKKDDAVLTRNKCSRI